jgi:hypothetical protein
VELTITKLLVQFPQTAGEVQLVHNVGQVAQAVELTGYVPTLQVAQVIELPLPVQVSHPAINEVHSTQVFEVVFSNICGEVLQPHVAPVATKVA